MGYRVPSPLWLVCFGRVRLCVGSLSLPARSKKRAIPAQGLVIRLHDKCTFQAMSSSKRPLPKDFVALSAPRKSRSKTGTASVSKPKNNTKGASKAKSNKRTPNQKTPLEVTPVPDTKGRVTVLEKQMAEVQTLLKKQTKDSKQNADSLLQMMAEMSKKLDMLAGSTGTEVIDKDGSGGESDSEREEELDKTKSTNSNKGTVNFPCYEKNSFSLISRLPSDSRERVSKLVSSTISIGDHVSQKERKKVWTGEFMDLTLLSPSHHYAAPEDDYSITWRSAGGNGPPSLDLVPKKNRSKVKSFSQWETLFDIYMAIYVENPVLQAEGSDLLTYKNNIKHLHSKNADWFSYDESFRTLRLQKGWAWSHRPEALLWSVAFPAFPSAAPEKETPFPSKNGSNGKHYLGRKGKGRFCFKFNDQFGVRCLSDSCEYKHICSICSENHPRSKCPTNGQ